MFIVSICIYGIIYKYPALHYAFWTGPNISLFIYCFDKTFDTHCFMFSVLCILFCYHSGFIWCGKLYFVAWKEHIIGWLNSGTSFFSFLDSRGKSEKQQNFPLSFFFPLPFLLFLATRSHTDSNLLPNVTIIQSLSFSLIIWRLLLDEWWRSVPYQVKGDRTSMF